MPMYQFGAGVMYGTPLTDAFGNAITVSTPLQLGVTQDVSVDISGDLKMLHGQNQFPVAVGRGKGKITGKIKFGQWNGAVINSLFFGQTMTSGLTAIQNDTVGSVIPTTPFQITPTIPVSGTWSVDLGVINASGNPMTKVASAPAVGQYSVAAGVYTFAAADAAQTVFINFQYTATSTVAKKSTILNVAMGAAPTFRCDFGNQYGGNGLNLSLFACISNKFTFSTKLDDFTIPEIDFEAFANSANQVGLWSTAA
jgi:hypothetical protein